MTLKTLLQEKGIKQKWLAENLHVSEVTVSSWCNGKSFPRKNKQKEINLLLNIIPEQLNETL